MPRWPYALDLAVSPDIKYKIDYSKQEECVIGYYDTCFSQALPRAWLPRLRTSNFDLCAGRRHSTLYVSSASASTV